MALPREGYSLALDPRRVVRLAQGEAGINDLINAYEPMERAYLQAVEASGGGEEAMPVVSCTGALEER